MVSMLEIAYLELLPFGRFVIWYFHKILIYIVSIIYHLKNQLLKITKITIEKILS